MCLTIYKYLFTTVNSQKIVLCNLENKVEIYHEFDKCIACEVCVRVCPIDLPVVDWKLETDIRKKRLLNYSIDFGICIFCGNCVEYCPTNCLSMTEEYELSTIYRHTFCID
ncbi:hypothetical protein HanPI659440_Chr09g0346641 [Helianthus annuus]|nr:hypothetical protein HanPI659440_Chr09g0346641 [Helianthus annuus]